MKQTSRIFGFIIVVISVLTISFVNPLSINDAGERTVIQPIRGDLWVQFDPGLYWAGFFAKRTVWPNNATVQVSTDDHASEDADLWAPPQQGTFSEGDAAQLGHTVKWDLPNTPVQMLDLHTTYNNSDIQKYGISASFSSIDEVVYEERIYKKLEEKIDAASDEATAKQKLITAQQEALTAKAEGEKQIAKTKATEEAAKIKAVIQAEKEAAVAEENLKRDKLKAASELALKKAAAEGDRLKVQAGLTPLERATIEKETAIGVAQALAGPQGIVFPKIVSGSSGSGGSSALQTMELKMLNDLVKDMSK